MYWKILTVAMVGFLSFSACSDAKSVDIKEGKWSITTDTSIEGMPFQMPPVTITQCLTQENYMPQQQNQNESDCKIINQKVHNSVVSWEMQCPDSHAFTKISYKHDTFDGTMQMQSNQEGGSMKISASMHGKYIGACE